MLGWCDNIVHGIRGRRKIAHYTVTLEAGHDDDASGHASKSLMLWPEHSAVIPIQTNKPKHVALQGRSERRRWRMYLHVNMHHTTPIL